MAEEAVQGMVDIMGDADDDDMSIDRDDAKRSPVPAQEVKQPAPQAPAPQEQQEDKHAEPQESNYECSLCHQNCVANVDDCWFSCECLFHTKCLIKYAKSINQRSYIKKGFPTCPHCNLVPTAASNLIAVSIMLVSVAKEHKAREEPLERKAHPPQLVELPTVEKALDNVFIPDIDWLVKRQIDIDASYGQIPKGMNGKFHKMPAEGSVHNRIRAYRAAVEMGNNFDPKSEQARLHQCDLAAEQFYMLKGRMKLASAMNVKRAPNIKHITEMLIEELGEAVLGSDVVDRPRKRVRSMNGVQDGQPGEA